MIYKKIGFIGCGNMGSALADCAAKSLGENAADTLFYSNRSSEKAQRLAEKLGGRACLNSDIAEDCDLIFIGVKPQMLEELFSEIAPVFKNRKNDFTLVSMVAGVTIERLREFAQVDCKVIRIMPNTAIAVGAGVIQYCGDRVPKNELEDFVSLISTAGFIDELPEKLMDAASAVSGCGPAFLCLAFEGMADGGVAVGLPRKKALAYAAQTVLGLGKLASETLKHPGILKDEVTSPGGTTIQGVRSLENGSVRASFMEAVIAAYEKTLELKENT